MSVAQGVLYHWDCIISAKVEQPVLPLSRHEKVFILTHESVRRKFRTKNDEEKNCVQPFFFGPV